MNLGKIITTGLQRAELPMDIGHIDLARNFANDNVSSVWNSVPVRDRIENGKTLSIVSGTSEYALDKNFDSFVKNSLQGPSTNPRFLKEYSATNFARYTAGGLSTTGYPLIYKPGEMRGFDSQLGSASVIKVASSLANVTTGTVKVVNGSNIVVFSSGVLSMNSVGLRLAVGSDLVSYKVGKYLSSTKAELVEAYRGVSATAASYKLGDVGVYVTVFGVVSGQEDSETLALDGTSTQTGAKSFTTVSRVTKSDKTGGRVTFTDNAGTLTVAVLSPNETDAERQTIVVWPTPSASETLTYSQFRKHPELYLLTDAVLLRPKWHKLVLGLTVVDLLEWAERPVPAKLARDIDIWTKELEREAFDVSNEQLIPLEEGTAHFGESFWIDKDPDVHGF